jgi:hypothetical protein
MQKSKETSECTYTFAKAAITTGVEESRLPENDHIRSFKQQLQTQWRQQWAEYASSSHNVYCKTYPDAPIPPDVQITE